MAAHPYIPNKGVGDNDIQSIAFGIDWEVQQAASARMDCVLFGCVLTQQGSPDMTVAVSRGAVLSNGVLLPVTAGNVTIGTADATNPRIDLIVVNSSGTKAVRAGTAAAAPKPPARSANDVVLGHVYVPASDTTITESQITRARLALVDGAGPIVVKKDNSLQTTNTTNAIFTVASLTLPRDIFNSSVSNWRGVRVYTAGNYLANNTTPTFTWTIDLNGTTLFADATGATTNDADRGAWGVAAVLNFSGSAVQQLMGLVSMQTPGAKTAPTTGTAGDLAVVTHVVAPIYGASTQDISAGDMDLRVRCTMSVSNSANELVRSALVFELY